jgi:hypothetical protein
MNQKQIVQQMQVFTDEEAPGMIIGAGAALVLYDVMERTRDLDLWMPDRELFYQTAHRLKVVVSDSPKDTWEVFQYGSCEVYHDPGFYSQLIHGLKRPEMQLLNLRVMSPETLVRFYRHMVKLYGRPKDHTHLFLAEKL